MPEFEHLHLDFKFCIANITNVISNADFEVHRIKSRLFLCVISAD